MRIENCAMIYEHFVLKTLLQTTKLTPSQNDNYLLDQFNFNPTNENLFETLSKQIFIYFKKQIIETESHFNDPSIYEFHDFFFISQYYKQIHISLRISPIETANSKFNITGYLFDNDIGVVCNYYLTRNSADVNLPNLLYPIGKIKSNKIIGLPSFSKSLQITQGSGNVDTL